MSKERGAEVQPLLWREGGLQLPTLGLCSAFKPNAGSLIRRTLSRHVCCPPPTPLHCHVNHGRESHHCASVGLPDVEEGETSECPSFTGS